MEKSYSPTSIATSKTRKTSGGVMNRRELLGKGLKTLFAMGAYHIIPKPVTEAVADGHSIEDVAYTLGNKTDRPLNVKEGQAYSLARGEDISNVVAWYQNPDNFPGWNHLGVGDVPWIPPIHRCSNLSEAEFRSTQYTITWLQKGYRDEGGANFNTNNTIFCGLGNCTPIYDNLEKDRLNVLDPVCVSDNKVNLPDPAESVWVDQNISLNANYVDFVNLVLNAPGVSINTVGEESYIRNCFVNANEDNDWLIGLSLGGMGPNTPKVDSCVIHNFTPSNQDIITNDHCGGISCSSETSVRKTIINNSRVNARIMYLGAFDLGNESEKGLNTFIDPFYIIDANEGTGNPEDMIKSWNDWVIVQGKLLTEESEIAPLINVRNGGSGAPLSSRTLDKILSMAPSSSSPIIVGNRVVYVPETATRNPLFQSATAAKPNVWKQYY